MSETYTIAPDLIWRDVDENTVVVSPQSGEMRVLNDMGSEIWRLLAEEKSIAEIEAHLTGRYEAAPERIGQDLRDFLAELQQKQLIVTAA